MAGCGCRSRPVPEVEARAALTRGVEFENEGNPDKAEAAYRKAAGCNSVRPVALADLAGILAQRGEFKTAENLYQESILLKMAPPALVNLARMYVIYGTKLDEAALYATVAAGMADSPDAAAACWHTAGLALSLDGHWAAAAECLSQGADLQLQSGLIQAPLGLDLARCLLMRDRPQEALWALDHSEPPDCAQAAALGALRGVALRGIARGRGRLQSPEAGLTAAVGEGSACREEKEP